MWCINRLSASIRKRSMGGIKAKAACGLRQSCAGLRKEAGGAFVRGLVGPGAVPLLKAVWMKHSALPLALGV